VPVAETSWFVVALLGAGTVAVILVLISLSGAALYTLAVLALWRLARNDLSYTHALVALLLLTCALVLMFEGDTLFFTLAAEADLHLVARRFSDRIISAGAHLLFAAAALWLAVRLVPEILGTFRTPPIRYCSTLAR
jgi:hypothetical protein